MEKKDEIKLINIHEELARLWRSHANGNKIRAYLFNLIVYTQEGRRADYFKELVHLIVEKFPCRIIFIQANPDPAQNYLRVQVFIEGLTNQNMLCEEISIEAAGIGLTRVPFLILPHLIADLPIYLLWGQDPAKEDKILPHLQNFASRLIFDSECTENLHRFSQMMLARLPSSRIDVMDMNWARIGGWREVLAQTFDTKERIEQLNACSTIKIFYNDRTDSFFSHPETQALYIQAWLAAQLEWTYKRMERKSHLLCFYYHFQDHPIQIILQPQRREDIPPEEIVALEFAGPDDYLCNLTRQTDTQVIVNSCTQYQCELPFNLILTNIRSSRNLMQEVFFQKPSEQYGHMLRLIGQIEGG